MGRAATWRAMGGASSGRGPPAPGVTRVGDACHQRSRGERVPRCRGVLGLARGARGAAPAAAPVRGALSKTHQYAVILKVAPARTATARAVQLRTAMTALQARGAL